MTSARDAMVQRRRLRVELRRARTGAGLAQRDVAQAMDWSDSKIIRIESGSVGISTNDLRALLRLYGVGDDDEINRFVTMARASRQSPWWSAYRDVASQQYLTLLGYESSASAIHQFHPAVVPGLLQDEEYIQAVLRRSARPPGSEEEARKRFELRDRRQQELFDQSAPPEMTFILDEAVLHRMVGGAEVMRRQLLHLQDVAARDNVTILVVPFSVGAHPSMTEPFMILEFPDFDDDVLYLEGPRDSLVSRESPETVESYRQTFGTLRSLAAEVDLETMLQKALSEMSVKPA